MEKQHMYVHTAYSSRQHSNTFQAVYSKTLLFGLPKCISFSVRTFLHIILIHALPYCNTHLTAEHLLQTLSLQEAASHEASATLGLAC